MSSDSRRITRSAAKAAAQTNPATPAAAAVAVTAPVARYHWGNQNDQKQIKMTEDELFQIRSDYLLIRERYAFWKDEDREEKYGLSWSNISRGIRITQRELQTLKKVRAANGGKSVDHYDPLDQVASDGAEIRLADAVRKARFEAGMAVGPLVEERLDE